MHNEMDQSYENLEYKNNFVIYTASGMTASFAAGFVSYLLRAGSLMSSFLSTVPLWKSYDPIAVLIAPRKKKEIRMHEMMQPSETVAEQKAENMFTEDENQ